MPARDVAEHRFGRSKAQTLAAGIVAREDTREAAFAAADIEHAPADEVAEVLEQSA